MASRRAPWTTAMLGHLADGRWYALDEVLRVGARAVPPGRAIQQREKDREACLVTGSGPRPARSDDDRIATGARRVAYGSLVMQIRTGHIERHGDLIRRAP